MAFYVTGDVHGNQLLWDACINPFLKPGDTIIVLGDFGVGFFDGRFWTEEMFYDYISEQPYTVLFCDGNHENFDKLYSYDVSVWNGGKVHYLRDNLIHLMRGEIYRIAGKTAFVFGGGYSIDKVYRVEGSSWWMEEMPVLEEYANGVRNLLGSDNRVNYILTHSASGDAIEYLSHLGLGIKNISFEEKPLNEYFKKIESSVQYDKWYFGHFHVDREIWRNQYAVLDAIRDIESGEIIKMRV